MPSSGRIFSDIVLRLVAPDGSETAPSFSDYYFEGDEGPEQGLELYLEFPEPESYNLKCYVFNDVYEEPQAGYAEGFAVVAEDGAISSKYLVTG